MKRRGNWYTLNLLTGSVLIALLLSGCTPSPEICPSLSYAALSDAEAYIDDPALPFRFPLDEASNGSSPSFTHYCSASSGPEDKRKYHVAEDYFQPAGTPVYAIAAGEISF